jgi:hypothetical protein
MNEPTCCCVSGKRAGRQGCRSARVRFQNEGRKYGRGLARQTSSHSKACFLNCIEEPNTSGSRGAVTILWIRVMSTLNPSMNGCTSIIFALYCKVCNSSPSTLSDPFASLKQFKQESLFQFGLTYAKTPDLDPARIHRPLVPALQPLLTFFLKSYCIQAIQFETSLEKDWREDVVL